VYSEIDVHNETYADNLEDWLIRNPYVHMHMVAEADGVTTWKAHDTGEIVTIDVTELTKSVITITQHDGRRFQTTIETKEI